MDTLRVERGLFYYQILIIHVFFSRGMSDEEIQKKTLASAVACLEGKSPGEKAAIIHQHLGRREMTDVIIETMKANPGMLSRTLGYLLLR